MRWVTFIWAVVIGACATMALPHLLMGIKRKTWENLFFAIAALSVAGIGCGELAIMLSRTAEEIGRAIQWTHLPVFFLLLAIVGFVRFYFGTGRLWLGNKRDRKSTRLNSSHQIISYAVFCLKKKKKTKHKL